MEERIKRIKVTKDNLLTVATFTRGDSGYSVPDITLRKIDTKRKVWKSPWKQVEEDVHLEFWYYTDPKTGKEYPIFTKKVKNDDIYDINIDFNEIKLGVEYDKSLRRYLTPIQIRENGTLASVNKITLNLQGTGEIVNYRLYFTETEREMWEKNLKALSDIMSGAKDTIWIEYSV